MSGSRRRKPTFSVPIANIALGRSQKFDATCFFAQQCIEKYLKGRRAEAGRLIPKTHDLSILLDTVLPLEPLWEASRPRLETLTSYAVLSGKNSWAVFGRGALERFAPLQAGRVGRFAPPGGAKRIPARGYTAGRLSRARRSCAGIAWRQCQPAASWRSCSRSPVVPCAPVQRRR